LFYTNTDGSFKILGIFYVEKKKREITELGRTHTAISYRLKGNSIFETKKGRILAKDDCISYIPAGCDYRRITKDDEQLIVLHLEGLGNIEKEFQTVNNAGEIVPMFEKMLSLWEERGTEAHNRCLSLLYQVFDFLQQKGLSEERPIPKKIEKGIRLMQRNFKDSRLSVSILSESCGVSESYFRRVYRQTYGISPWRAIQNSRYQHACNLLRSGYYSPKQAAELSGFTDVKYFRTAFKKQFGITPTEYIKNR